MFGRVTDMRLRGVRTEGATWGTVAAAAGWS